MFLQSFTLHLEMDSMALIAFVFYLIVLMVIGVYSARFSSKGINEYFIGGRRLSPFVVALSAVVSGRSAWLLLGFSATAYKLGLAAVWAVVGYIVMEFLMFLYMAPRLRSFGENYDVITIPDFFVAKFGDKNHLLRAILVSVIVIFMVAYVSSQLVAGGKAFASSFGITVESGMILTTFVILLYTLLGGFLAVSLTDVVQAFFMVLSLVVVPLVAIDAAGGWSEVAKVIKIQKSDFFNPFSIASGSIIGFIGIGLGSLGSPHILVRYLSIQKGANFKNVAIIGTLWNVLMAFGAMFIGFAARFYFNDLGEITAGDTENIFPDLAFRLLPSVLFGVVVASIFAAIMSTADSQLLVAASALVRDIYQKIIKNGQAIADSDLVWYSRISVLVIVLIALILGLAAEKQIFWLVLFAWGGLGASIGATILLTLFWRHTTRNGVIAGIVTGTISIFIWQNIPVLDALIYELIPAFALTTIVTMGVSQTERFIKK